MEDLANRNIRFVSITESIDTATPMGEVWFQLNSNLAQNERAVLMERTKAGLKAAKERGKNGGRPKGLTPDNERKMKAVKKMIVYFIGPYLINLNFDSIEIISSAIKSI